MRSPENNQIRQFTAIHNFIFANKLISEFQVTFALGQPSFLRSFPQITPL